MATSQDQALAVTVKGDSAGDNERSKEWNTEEEMGRQHQRIDRNGILWTARILVEEKCLLITGGFLLSLFIPCHKNVVGYYVIPPEPFECLPIHPSISTNLSSFWLIFFKLCMDIDIGEEWVGIANRLHLFLNNRVLALDWCKNVFFFNIFRTNGWILIKFCICLEHWYIQDPCCI